MHTLENGFKRKFKQDWLLSICTRRENSWANVNILFSSSTNTLAGSLHLCHLALSFFAGDLSLIASRTFSHPCLTCAVCELCKYERVIALKISWWVRFPTQFNRWASNGCRFCECVCVFVCLSTIGFVLTRSAYMHRVLQCHTKLRSSSNDLGGRLVYIHTHTHKTFQQFFQPKFPSGFQFSFSAFESEWWHKQPPCLSAHFRCIHTYGFIFASWTNLSLKPIYLHIECVAVVFVSLLGLVLVARSAKQWNEQRTEKKVDNIPEFNQLQLKTLPKTRARTLCATWYVSSLTRMVFFCFFQLRRINFCTANAICAEHFQLFVPYFAFGWGVFFCLALRFF